MGKKQRAARRQLTQEPRSAPADDDAVAGAADALAAASLDGGDSDGGSDGACGHVAQARPAAVKPVLLRFAKGALEPPQARRGKHTGRRGGAADAEAKAVWLCLSCGFVGWGGAREDPAAREHFTGKHCFALTLVDVPSPWCVRCAGCASRRARRALCRCFKCEAAVDLAAAAEGSGRAKLLARAVACQRMAARALEARRHGAALSEAALESDERAAEAVAAGAEKEAGADGRRAAAVAAASPDAARRVPESAEGVVSDAGVPGRAAVVLLLAAHVRS